MKCYGINPLVCTVNFVGFGPTHYVSFKGKSKIKYPKEQLST